MFKDKLQELIDKNTVELDADMRAATTDTIFVKEEMVNFVEIQDDGNDGDDDGNRMTFEGKIIRKRRQ